MWLFTMANCTSKESTLVARDTFDIVGRLSTFFLESILLRENEEEALTMVAKTLSDMVCGRLPCVHAYTKARAPKYDEKIRTSPHMAVVYAAKRANPGMEPAIGERVPYVIGILRDRTRIRDPDWDAPDEVASSNSKTIVKKTLNSRRRRRAVLPTNWSRSSGLSKAGVSSADDTLHVRGVRKALKDAKKKKDLEGVAEKARSPSELEKSWKSS